MEFFSKDKSMVFNANFCYNCSKPFRANLLGATAKNKYLCAECRILCHCCGRAEFKKKEVSCEACGRTNCRTCSTTFEVNGNSRKICAGCVTAYMVCPCCDKIKRKTGFIIDGKELCTNCTKVCYHCSSVYQRDTAKMCTKCLDDYCPKCIEDNVCFDCDAPSSKARISRKEKKVPVAQPVQVADGTIEQMPEGIRMTIPLTPNNVPQARPRPPRFRQRTEAENTRGMEYTSIPYPPIPDIDEMLRTTTGTTTTNTTNEDE